MNERARILSQWIDYLDRLAFPYQPPPNPAALMRNTEEMERLLQEILSLLQDMRAHLMQEPEAPSDSDKLPPPVEQSLAEVKTPE